MMLPSVTYVAGSTDNPAPDPLSPFQHGSGVGHQLLSMKWTDDQEDSGQHHNTLSISIPAAVLRPMCPVRMLFGAPVCTFSPGLQSSTATGSTAGEENCFPGSCSLDTSMRQSGG
ncbi:hypothetical protein EK904_009615 [Melospiza melodia maxima]|nr:hypothetical protein EK904_009615 [Melospiza melodia maxima]